MKKHEAPVVVQETYNASVEDVWNAITKVDQMRQWYFDNIPSFKPKVGFKTQFNVENDDRDFMHVWTVTEVVPLQKISYDWRYEGRPGDSWVVFEVTKQGKGTSLRVTHSVREDFPDEIPEFKRESCLGGWTYFLTESLKQYLEKKS